MKELWIELTDKLIDVLTEQYMNQGLSLEAATERAQNEAYEQGDILVGDHLATLADNAKMIAEMYEHHKK